MSIEKQKTIFPERDPRVTTMMLQALADLGYPKSAWNAMKYDEVKEITENQIVYKPSVVVPLVKKQDEAKSEIVIPKYEGDPQHQAAYELDLGTLQNLDYEALESRDKNGDTSLHLVVIMAFRDFAKAEEIISFFKRKGIEFDSRNNEGLTALDIAKRRATVTPAYQKIVEVLEN